MNSTIIILFIFSKGPNDPFEQLLAGDKSKELPAEINPRLNITTDSAASSPEKPLVHQRDPSIYY